MKDSDGNEMFRCKCGSTRIEEVSINCVVASEIRRLDADEDGPTCEYGEDVVIDGGSVDHYQCKDCGAVVFKDSIGLPVTSLEELRSVLKGRRS